MWRQSQELKEIGTAALRRWNEEQRTAPKCGARTKKSGEPCQARALENGRCKVHGGLTPKGDDWHKPRFTARTGFYERKLARKLADLEKRRRKAAERVAAMTPERRARYEQWHRTHKATSLAARAAARREAKQNAESRAMLAKREVAESHRLAEAASAPAQHEQVEPRGERIMPKSKTTAANAAAAVLALRQTMQIEGLQIAYRALVEVASDKKAPAQARATAATSIYRGAGLFDKVANPDEKPVEERSPEEILAHVDRQLSEMRDDREDDEPSGFFD